MADRPTLYELEQAILCYSAPPSSQGALPWSSMGWLWGQLSLVAKIASRVGVSGTEWWKERYILPLLLAAAMPHLQRYEAGEWTRTEEESLRHCFLLFAPYVSKGPSFFSPALARFLSDTPPSFIAERDGMLSRLVGGKNTFWARGETFAHYQTRLRSLMKRSPMPLRPVVEEERVPHVVAEPVTEATREKLRKLLAELTQVKEEVARLSDQIDHDVAHAFPFRLEAGDLLTDVQKSKEETTSILLYIDDALLYLSDHLVGGVSNSQLSRLIQEEERALADYRPAIAALARMEKAHSASIEEIRATSTHRLHQLTRRLDHVPMLGPTHPFRSHQVQLLKTAREKLKRFRSALVKGPGPEISFFQLEQEMGKLEKLALAFYEEGKEIAFMRERLHRFADQIQALLSHTGSSASDRVEWLQKLLAEVTDLQGNLEVSADRKRAFDRIAHEMEYL